MESINRVTLLGRVVADLDLKETKTGKTVTTFSVATNNEWVDEQGELHVKTDFHRIVAWEGLAKLCSSRLKKGAPLFLEGRLHHRSYVGKDELRHFVTEIVLSTVRLLERPKFDKIEA